MKNRVSKHTILLIYSVSVVLGTTITALLTIIISAFQNYKILITTNTINEYCFEIILLSSGIIIFIYELTRMFRQQTR